MRLTERFECLLRLRPFKKLCTFLDIQLIDLIKLTTNEFTRQVGPFWSIKAFCVNEIEFQFGIFQKMIRQHRLHANAPKNAQDVLVPACVELFNR